MSLASGQTVYYWDANGTTSGFGTASGTWGSSSFFSTNASGTVATSLVTTTLSDDLNFGTATTSMGLATGTVAVSGSQSIRSLLFGSQSGVLTLSGGTIGLAASGTITANQATNTNTIDSILAGAATGLVKNGVGTAILTQANTYSGSTSVTAGTLTLGGANGSILSSANIGVTGATFTLDNATSNNNDRLGSSATVALNAGSTLLFNGNGATASTTESFGTLGFGGGQATVTLANAGAGQLQTLSATSVSRAAGAVGLVRGASLQTAATNATRLTIGGTDGTGLSFVGSGTSAVGTSTVGTDKTLRIVPYLVGDTSATGNGSSFLTYDTNATAFGLRPLATGEYTTLATGYTTPATAENVNAFNGTITTASPTVNSLRFATASQTLNGSGTLTINSGAILATAATTAIGSGFSSVSLGNGTWNEGVIQVASGNTFTVNAPIAVTGGGGLTKGLAGNLTLNAANTYTGDTVVNAGNLTLGTSGLLGSGNYAGALRSLGTATLTLTNTASQVFTGSLASAGLLTLNAPGAVSISGGLTTSAGLTVGGSAGTTTIAGPWTNSSGIITVGSGKVLSFGGGTLTAPLAQNITGGGTLAFTSGSAAFGGPAVGSGGGLVLGANVIQSGGIVSGSGGQGLWIGANGSHGSYTITGGTLALVGSQAGGAGLVVAYMNTANATNGTLTIDGDAALVSVRSTGGSPTIVWSWGGAGVANGTLNLARGELQYASEVVSLGSGSVTALFNLGGPSGTATIRPVGINGLTLSAAITRTLLGSNGVISSTDASDVARSVTVNGAIGESGGSQGLTFAGSGTTTITGTNTYSGTTWLKEGTLRTSSTTPFVNSPLEISAGATFVTGTSGVATYSLIGLSGSGTVSLGGNTLTVGSNNATTTYSGAITGAAGGVTKLGTGSLTLSASSSYTGATVISGGRLEIGSGGQINGTSGITINGSDAELKYNSATALTKSITFTQGTLSGTGTIGTAVTAGANDILSPGNSPGAQSFTSGLTWDPAGTYLWEINNATSTSGTGWDIINVSGGSGLAINATSGTTFKIAITSLSGTAAGNAANFSATTSGSWTILSSSSISGFAANKFNLDRSAFTNTTSGSFTISQVASGANQTLVLAYNTISALSSSTSSVTGFRVMQGQATTTAVNLLNAGPDTTGYSLSPSGGLSLVSSSTGTLAGGTQAITFGYATTAATGSRSGTVSFTNTGNSGDALGSIAVSGAVVTNRAVTASAVDFGLVHLGASGTATSTFTSTGSDNDFTRITVNNGTGGGLTVDGSSDFVFNGSGGSSRTVAGTFATAGALSGTISLTNASAESGGTLPGQVPGTTGLAYSASVFSGSATWNVAGGGSWGTQASGTSWTSTGNVQAAPGTFTGYANTDKAIFAGTQGGTSTVLLNGATPSLAAISFTNTANRYVIDQGSGGSLTLASSGGKPTIEVASGGLHEIKTAILGSAGLQKLGGGTLVLSGSNGFTGGTDISAGTLAVNGAIAGAVNVATDAILGGSGSVAGALTGAGLVSPGNSPGILAAGQFDPSGGLDAAFEFTGLAPTYNVPTASVNDVLRLTNGSDPLASGAFTAANVIDVYFNVGSIASGQIYEGGFFTGVSAASLLAALDGKASFNYWAKTTGTPTRSFGGFDYVSLTSLPGITGVTLQTSTRIVDFGSGNVTGSVTQFVIVPEPGAAILLVAGVAVGAMSLRRRRRLASDAA